MSALPIVDLGPFVGGDPRGRDAVGRQIAAACRDAGFFYVVGHGVEGEVLERLAAASREFFALPAEAKSQIAMARGGRAWRGWFPVGGELTSGAPDRKEGLYFGTDLPADHPRVRAGVPMHGANLFPAQVPTLAPAVREYTRRVTDVGHALAAAVARSLGLDDEYFARHYTAEPTVLFRVFHYPPGDDEAWGVGEHTDYGFLTLLAQDDAGGLEVKTPRGWVAARPVPGALVCNIGDMLDRLTGGTYRSTPHRVRNTSGRSRLSFPLFFDPDVAAEVRPLPASAAIDDRAERWDGASVHAFSGTYGDYLLGKVARVFPELFAAVAETA